MSGITVGGGGDGWEWSATSSHKEMMETLLTTGFQSDLTIVLGPNKDKEAGVHKIFLQCGSRVLHSKIMKCGGSNRLELEDVQDYASFVMMLKFLYTGDSGATINEALPLLKMATEFEVMKLRDQCATILQGKITQDNVLPLFEDAMKYAHKNLISSSLKFICCNACSILKLPIFSQLRLECLIEIIQQDDLRVITEMEVFNAVYEWAKAECERQGIDPASNEVIRKVIDKPLKYVRFPLMDKEQFAMNVATKNLLSTDDAMGLLMCFLVSPKNRTSLPQGRFISAPRKFFRQAVGWEICRGKPDIRFHYEGASALHEALCFSVKGLYSLKLQSVVFPEGILPENRKLGKTWLEDCRDKHKWNIADTHPLQVEIILYEDDLEVMRKSQHLISNSQGTYFVSFVSTLKPDTSYKMMAKFSGKSYCCGFQNCTSCVYSPLRSLVGLNNVLNFNRYSPATILDNKGKPVVSPPFEIQFEREGRNDIMPISST